MRRALPPAWFVAGVALLLGVRAFHLGPALDGPHLWRQMDTAQYVRSFAQDGIDLLRPSVCWMGAHRTVVLECPWPEAVAALAQRGAAPADQRPSRLVFLGFFLLALSGFHAAARTLVGTETARFASLLYLASPLAQFYSRAVHVDFSALAGIHALLALWLHGLGRGRWPPLLAGLLLGALGALVKGPYLLPPLLALLPALLAAERRLALRAAPLLLLPALAFALWRAHAEAVNAAAPDWSFIPDYHPMTGMSTWYLGTLAQRFDPHAWAVLLRDRLGRELLGPLGLPLAALGVLVLRRSTAAGPLLLWSLGGALHVLLFFNLNVVHDYYQLPLLAPLALLAALPLQRARELCPARLRALPLLALVLVAASAVAWAERHGYQRWPGFEAAGAALEQQTAAGSLGITSWWTADARSPHLLFLSQRMGWGVREQFLEAKVVDRLRDEGASWLAVVRHQPFRGALAERFAAYPLRTTPLPDGQVLLLYELRPGALR